MHPQAMGWVRKKAGRRAYPIVYDIGGRDINGSPRDVIEHGAWVGVDLHPGPGVDVVMDVRDWEPKGGVRADLTLCLEVLEHARDWRGILRKCRELTKPGGLLIVTCAAPPREPHSGMDGGKLNPGEYYGNVEAHALGAELPGAEIEWDEDHGDLRAAVRV